MLESIFFGRNFVCSRLFQLLFCILHLSHWSPHVSNKLFASLSKFDVINLNLSVNLRLRQIATSFFRFFIGYPCQFYVNFNIKVNVLLLIFWKDYSIIPVNFFANSLINKWYEFWYWVFQLEIAVGCFSIQTRVMTVISCLSILKVKPFKSDNHISLWLCAFSWTS